MPFHRRQILLAGLAALPPNVGSSDLTPSLFPPFRIAPEGWGTASLAEVTAVLQSASHILWRSFAEPPCPPFVVLRGRDGPIVHYQRNIVGEIVMKLDTQDTLWCQYVYQFAHEFCHILVRFSDRPHKQNHWFEETLCETASLYVLRRLSDLPITTTPPFPSWRTYAPEFRRYALSIMDSRTQIGTAHLADFYAQHRATLARNPKDRALNGAMAVTLLELLEATPSSWAACYWLNHSPAEPTDTFSTYLTKWRAAAPKLHQPFINEIMRRFGVTSP